MWGRMQIISATLPGFYPTFSSHTNSCLMAFPLFYVFPTLHNYSTHAKCYDLELSIFLGTGRGVFTSYSYNYHILHLSLKRSIALQTETLTSTQALTVVVAEFFLLGHACTYAP